MVRPHNVVRWADDVWDHPKVFLRPKNKQKEQLENDQRF